MPRRVWWLRLGAAVLATLAAVSGLGPLVASEAAAQDYASLHKQVRLGGKVCFATHEHYGESDPFPTRAVAERAAIRAWAAFVVFEYGALWGSYERAAGKRMTCKSVGGLTQCSTTARPCRAAGGG
jgi:hypothetical protein